MVEGIEAKDLERLTQAARLAPNYARAAPTPEHLDPVYFSLGAAGNSTPSTIFDSWQHGNLSLRALAWS
jgi:4,5-DOPA dioxygenase extradiol